MPDWIGKHILDVVEPDTADYFFLLRDIYDGLDDDLNVRLTRRQYNILWRIMRYHDYPTNGKCGACSGSGKKNGQMCKACGGHGRRAYVSERAK